MAKYTLLFILAGLLTMNCAGRSKSAGMTADERFNRGLERFEKGRWAKATEDFSWVVLNNPAGNLAAEAQYYHAECLYQQKLYVEAQVEFERLLRRWAQSQHQGAARYRITQCLIEQSPKYYYDQEVTADAIDELQAFIDDFPDSEYRDDAAQAIQDLREKIAKKNYEAGRQYLKWKQAESARLYFKMILSQYYDTPYADEARVGMVISYIIAEDIPGAEEYYRQENENFLDAELRRAAEGFIRTAKNGSFDLKFYTSLYK